MSCTPATFPRELLTQPWTERAKHFQRYTTAHPRLLAARDTLVNAIHELPSNSLILLLGPTGVGKSTLRAKMEQLLTAEMLPALETDPSRLPFVSVECIAPESGNFNWREHFRRLLVQMDEPLVECKIDPSTPIRVRQGTARFMPSGRGAGAEYHYAVEKALAFRRPAAVLIDEAQHLSKTGSGRRLSDQLDVIKSLANRTNTVHILIGTYELLAFRNLSAQLSRRSIDIHFPRYRADSDTDLKTFRTVLRSLEQQLPLPKPSNLDGEWEYMYERSIGCVGILKDWLFRALVSALRRNSDTLTLKDLQEHALSVAQCDMMLSEVLEGERSLNESEAGRTRLRSRLGLTGKSDAGDLLAIPILAGQKRNRKPGQRKPGRDPVGAIDSLYAAASAT
jgi:hypothetical protein